MEPFYAMIFGVAAVLAAILEYGNRAGKSQAATSREFTLFRNNYLIVYSLMMGGCPGGPELAANKRAGYGWGLRRSPPAATGAAD